MWNRRSNRYKNIVPVLLEGLQSSNTGAMTQPGLPSSNQLARLRSVGRVSELAARASGISSTIGIAHTRWKPMAYPPKETRTPMFPEAGGGA